MDLRGWIVAGLIWTAFAQAVQSAPSDSGDLQPLTFESRIRPILKANCFQCHGDEIELEGKLDLRLVRLMRTGSESGPAIVSGKPEESLLVERISAGEMPPGKKKLSPEEVLAIRQWIDEGAKTARPEPATAAEAALTEEERSFWSFQGVRRPSVPQVKQRERIDTPIDAFLLERLEQENLTFSPEADKTTLIRRAYFDLIGLPPTPEQIAALVADGAPDAWERLIDRLLASPHYGERWGRHWLDIAGYADSDGYNEKDAERKYAFKYRDYVIRSFNEDKSIDQFIVEQLAGDELIQPPYEDLEPDKIEKLVATGFLRMGPDGTADPAVDQMVARNDVISETIKIVTTSLLGLSVGCAQCHDHRYDPILQADYYAIRAIFEPAYDWKAWRTAQERRVSLLTSADKKRAEAIDAEILRVTKEQDGYFKSWLLEVLKTKIAQQLPEEVREAALQAVQTPKDERTKEQAALLKKYPLLNMRPGELRREAPEKYQADLDRFFKRMSAMKAESPEEDFIHALTEVPGHVPPTYLFKRGDFHQPAQEVNPGELAVLCGADLDLIPKDDPALPTSGRRLAYARHLTSGRHPLTARVLVNRIWMHHFGRGIVSTPSDFGTQGERPTHPELLDWLADELVRPESGQPGWRLKPLHKRIMNSTAYRQTSRRTEELEAVDPENRLLGRMNVRRLEAETIRDALLAISGKLNERMFGPPLNVTPDSTGQIVLGVDKSGGTGRTVRVTSLGAEANRRSVYVQARRSMPLAMLETFDAPAMAPNCEARSASTVAPQSLLLMNNELVIHQSEAFAQRLIKEAGDKELRQVRRAWQLALGREPSERQLARGVAYLIEQQQNFAAAESAGASKAAADPARMALATLCQALVSSNAFLYVD